MQLCRYIGIIYDTGNQTPICCFYATLIVKLKQPTNNNFSDYFNQLYTRLQVQSLNVSCLPSLVILSFFGCFVLGFVGFLVIVSEIKKAILLKMVEILLLNNDCGCSF